MKSFYNTADLSLKSIGEYKTFTDEKGAKWNCFYYLTSDTDNDEIVGVTFKKVTPPSKSTVRSSGGRTYVYTFIRGEGLYRSGRLLNKAKVLPEEVHQYLYDLILSI